MQPISVRVGKRTHRKIERLPLVRRVDGSLKIFQQQNLMLISKHVKLCSVVDMSVQKIA